MTPADALVHSFLQAASDTNFPAVVFYASVAGTPDIRLVGNTGGERIKSALAWFAGLNVKAVEALARATHDLLANAGACAVCGQGGAFDAVSADGQQAHLVFVTAQIEAVKASTGANALNQTPEVPTPRIHLS